MQTRNSGQCGRRVADGSIPPICHVHQQKGNVGSLTQPVDANPEDIYQRLMRDSDPAIRLRAVDAWLAYQDKKKSGCDTCRARAEAEKRSDQFVAALSEAERYEMGDVMAPYHQFKERMYLRHPDLRPDIASSDPTPRPRVVTRSETLEVTPLPPVVRPRVVVDRGRAEPEPEPEPVVVTQRLAFEHFESVGIYTMRDPLTGKTFGLTHSLGDEHAQAIINGDITLEDAQRAHRDAQESGSEFFAATLSKIQGGS
jgi:hypothetical protein